MFLLSLTVLPSILSEDIPHRGDVVGFFFPTTLLNLCEKEEGEMEREGRFISHEKRSRCII